MSELIISHSSVESVCVDSLEITLLSGDKYYSVNLNGYEQVIIADCPFLQEFETLSDTTVAIVLRNCPELFRLCIGSENVTFEACANVQVVNTYLPMDLREFGHLYAVKMTGCGCLLENQWLDKLTVFDCKDWLMPKAGGVMLRADVTSLVHAPELDFSSISIETDNEKVIDLRRLSASSSIVIANPHLHLILQEFHSIECVDTIQQQQQQFFYHGTSACCLMYMNNEFTKVLSRLLLAMFLK